MKRVSVILINSIYEIENTNEEIEIIYTDSKNVRESIKKAKGKYVCFICNNDEVTDNYFDVIYNKSFEEFDSCFINYRVDYPGVVVNNENKAYDHLSAIRPMYLEYIFNYLIKKEKLIRIINLDFDSTFDIRINELIKENVAILDEIYIHHPNSTQNTLENMPYIDYKTVEYYKNVIYVKLTLTAKFNGIITWLMNIGRIFGKKYDITIIYNDIYDETKDKLAEYFTMVRRENFTNYLCDNYITTYLDYFIPLNIMYYNQSSTFITGLMLGDDNLSPNVFDRYFGVSKTCADTIKFGFETDYKPEYIHNPIKIDKRAVKPHLRLVSTLRSEECKGLDRLEKISKILDEEDIPYTWNVFTDINEGTNHSGFIYRNAIYDPLPYIKDSDYLIMLSDIESFCYSVVEALLLNTKVVVTPVEVFKEIGVDEENGLIIPFEYFDDENHDKLREKVLEMYENKDKKIRYKAKELNFMEFAKLLKK